MTETILRTEAATATATAAKLNYSYQRQIVLDTVLNSREHMTALQVYHTARQQCSRLSLGTVYRNLNTLVEIGKIRRVSIPGEADRFDWELADHQHFYCRKCKKVLNLEVSMPALQQLVGNGQKMYAEQYNFVVTGLCDDCAGE